MYLDEDLFISRGNYGTIHVGVRSSLLMPEVLSNNETANADNNETQPKPLDHAHASRSSGRKRNLTRHGSGNCTTERMSGSATLSSLVQVWNQALSKDLKTRSPSFVAQDLNDILSNYGWHVCKKQRKNFVESHSSVEK